MSKIIKLLPLQEIFIDYTKGSRTHFRMRCNVHLLDTVPSDVAGFSDLQIDRDGEWRHFIIAPLSFTGRAELRIFVEYIQNGVWKEATIRADHVSQDNKEYLIDFEDYKKGDDEFDLRVKIRFVDRQNG